MFKSLLIVLFTFITSDFLFAQQQNDLEIQGNTSNLYIRHTVSSKENFFSIGRMYNVNAKELASYNHLHFESGLDIGQILKIPLEKNNFTQSTKTEPNYSLVPVYHTILTGETLYRLGVNYNKVSLASLKKWNNLSSDAVVVGNRVIVGYLKVDKQLSTLDKNSGNTVSTPAVNQQKEANPVSSRPDAIAPAPKEQPAENPKINSPASIEQPRVTTETPTTKSNSNFSGGVFKQLYAEQSANKSIQNKSGQAGVFKSTSGWQDGKYYCFSNDAAAGTILKITNNASGKSVYAKVLDSIPDIQQNAGLIAVISNAAASELGTGESKFDCTVNY